MIAMFFMWYVNFYGKTIGISNDNIIYLWCIIFIITLPWSIILFCTGAIGLFGYKEWYGPSLLTFSVISTFISAYINGYAISAFVRSIYKNNKSNQSIHCDAPKARR